MARRRCDRGDVQNRGEVGTVVQELGGVARNYQAAGLKFNFLVEKNFLVFFLHITESQHIEHCGGQKCK